MTSSISCQSIPSSWRKSARVPNRSIRVPPGPVALHQSQDDSDNDDTEPEELEDDDLKDMNESTSERTNTLDYNDWFGSSDNRPSSYPCPDCAKCFSDTDDLRSHLREYHGVVYSTMEKKKRVRSKAKDKTKEKIKKVLPKGGRHCKECDQM